MKLKYSFLLFLLLSCFACTSDHTPQKPDPQPEEENGQKPGDGGGEDKPVGPGVVDCAFPTDFTEALIGKEVQITNELVVTETYGDRLSGSILLSPTALRTPTDVVFPGSDEYRSLQKENQKQMLQLNPSVWSLLEPSTRTLRLGSTFSQLKGKVSNSNGRYVLTLTAAPKIIHAERPAFIRKKADLMVVSMNLEYYMASSSNWGYANGARNQEQFNRQSEKIVAAMKEMSADIFAICEIEEGKYSPAYLVDALNKAVGKDCYRFVDTGDTKVSKYTKNTFIYNKEVVSPYKNCVSYDGSYLKLRHINQCFTMNASNERFILSVNHFKSKVGKNASGSDADQHDGQSSFNNRRVTEALNCLKTYDRLKTYYNDPDVLVVGDLNSHSKEDPIRVFTDAGYTEELMKYAPASYSYCYHGQVAYLDHLLSSSTMTSQVIDAYAWNVNASEPDGIGYQFPDFYRPDYYRFSDHNPVVAFLNLK